MNPKDIFELTEEYRCKASYSISRYGAMAEGLNMHIVRHSLALSMARHQLADKLEIHQLSPVGSFPYDSVEFHGLAYILSDEDMKNLVNRIAGIVMDDILKSGL